MLTREQENARTMARLLGISDEDAVERLTKRVVISASDPVGEVFASYIRRIAGLTIIVVDSEPADLAVAINGTPAADAPTVLHMRIDGDGLAVSLSPLAESSNAVAPPDIGLRIAACYGAGCTIAQTVLGGLKADPFVVSFETLGLTHALASAPIQLNDAVLAGAGGVSSGFVWALEHAPVSGVLDVADPKMASPGNLNRHLQITEADVASERPKAEVICERGNIPALTLRPYVGTFADIRKARGRVKRVIVTVDSPRARRDIQGELPLEVLDASTTDVRAVVTHTHSQPNDGACLSCVYKHSHVEDERDRSVAEGLALTVEDVRQEFITADIARRLKEQHPELDEGALVGTALTSLYKSLCGADALKTAAGRQAFAPFAFVSILAGALLALELMKFEATEASGRQAQYQSLDPWAPPHKRARRVRGRDTACEFCAKSRSRATMSLVWPEAFSDTDDQDAVA